MPFPKPASPALNALHGFANSLAVAWLFNESTGITVRDYSGNNLHLICTNVSDGSWSVTGATEVSLRFGLGVAKSSASPGSQASLNFASGTHAWTETYVLRTRGGADTKPRLRSRTGNVIDLAILVAADRSLEFFTGSWVVSGGSSVSGADEVWSFVHASDTTLTVYKNGASVGSVGANVQNTGQLYLWAPPADVTAEYTQGDMVGGFIHSRALSAQEIASHYSAPFEAWDPPPAAPGGGGYASPSTFTSLFTPSVPGWYGAGSPPDLNDWIGGR